MNHQPVKKESSHAGAIEQALIAGDLSRLSPEERLAYYKRVCESLGLNPLTKPFEYIKLDGKLRLYARRDAADQLRKIHGISIEIVNQKREGDLYIVHVRARDREGRTDEEMGVVSIAGLKGGALANAILKAVTKAKRRVTLSLAGLGWLDETEVETIPDAQPVHPVQEDSTSEVSEYDRLLKTLNARMAEHGIDTKEKKLSWCSFMLEREIKNARDLSIYDVRYLLGELSTQEQQVS